MKWCLGIIFFIVVWMMLGFISVNENPRMITKLAPSEPAYLLEIDQHIRLSKRPADPTLYPIKLGDVGPVKPLFSGDMHYPFICMTEESRLGQPMVDNQQQLGMPVYKDGVKERKRSQAIGYSKDCSIPTQLKYFAAKDKETIREFDGQLAEDETLIRVEAGVINRYIYLIAMPINRSEIDDRAAQSKWNQKLIYQFAGGAGIGFRQGRMRPDKLIKRRLDELRLGYAVVSSGANRTAYTYNLLISEDTGRRLKTHFISLYGEPKYTVGIGGSGGGLSQYLMAQNAPGLIDAAMPLYSYPDMVSQTLYALDCDLLNTYYTFRADDKSHWQDWPNRIPIDGLNAKNGEPHKGAYFQPINQLLNGVAPSLPKGNSECINGWFGLYAFVHNPKQGWLRDYVSEPLKRQIHWNYWQDMVNVYGKDEAGFARHVWSNRGVQYGLLALQQGQITPEQFLHLNQNIGGWRTMERFKPERIVKVPVADVPIWLSLWGHHNVTRTKDQPVAPRKTPDYSAIENAYRFGQVFLGKADIPILDVRHYLEDDLDMHHVSATFAARKRLMEYQGHADNQVVWVADEAYFPVPKAFEMLDQWMQNLKTEPDVVKAKPDSLQDICFNDKGEVIAQGDTVWHGEWNQQPKGKCSQAFPVYSNSRIQAGSQWSGAVFDCALMSVEQAVQQNLYQHNMRPYLDELQQVFPDGVCDYSQPDQAKPKDLGI